MVHPGGPFWAGKDTHAWSIPKGEFDPETEQAIDAAAREFAEEVGMDPPADRDAWVALTPVRAGRKTVYCWLVEGDLDPSAVASNHFEMEWPPKSGRLASFPEVDGAIWCPIDIASTKLHKGLGPLCRLIEDTLASR